MRKMFTTLKSVVAATVIAAMALAASCSYDDSGINQRVDRVEKDLAALTERVAALEKKLADEVDALSKLINGKTVVTKVEKAEDGATTVTLSDGTSFVVYPECTVVDTDTDTDTDTYLSVKAEDGVLYWAIFEKGEFKEWLLNDGQKVPVYDGNDNTLDDDICDGGIVDTDTDTDTFVAPYFDEESNAFYYAVLDSEGFVAWYLVNGEKVAVYDGNDDTQDDNVCDNPAKISFRVENGNLEFSVDGGLTWTETGLSAASAGAQVIDNVEDNGNYVTFTLPGGASFNVMKAEVIEFEAAKSAIYVKAGETLSIAFAINDAVEDINIMNTPLGWKASVEAPTRAVGGMDYVLNITGPAKNFLQYAEKSGKIAVHFNTAAGACKVMNIDVELASIDLQVDKAGNITIVNTMVDRYERENWGQVEYIEEFNNFYFAVVGLDDYEACDGDLKSVYNSNWGEFDIPAATSYIQNFYTNVGENSWENATYVDGENEKWTVNFTVEEVIDYLDWYNKLSYEGNSFMVCVIPTDAHDNGSLVWEEMVAAPFKQLSVSIVENVEARAFNNVYFDVTLRGGSAYSLYPVSKADVDMYVNDYGYASAEAYFWAMLESYLQNPEWYSFGFKIESDVVEPNISFAELIAYTTEYNYFELAPNTEYVMCLFVEEDGKTEYTIEDLKLYEFATADITLAEPAMKISYEFAEEQGLYNIAVDVTVPDTVCAAYTRWYDEEQDMDELKADLIAYGYGRDASDFKESHTFFVGTNVDEPGTVKYLGVLVIDAAGNYTLECIELQSDDLVINETYVPTIESVTFDAEGAHITVGGLEGADVKAYQYYIISTTGQSYYQRTQEQLYDIAYSSSWLYQSSETNPILATRTADYASFVDGIYKVAVGVQFADGTYSNCVYVEYTYVQPAEELASVTAAYQEDDPNYYALTLTKANGDVITTTAGNGGVNYLNEGVWDFQLYYSSGYALGNTYMNGTQWVSDIKITVAYVDGKYDLLVNSSVGKFHYYGDIEGLVVPENTGGEAGDANTLEILYATSNNYPPIEMEVLFWQVDNVAAVIDFKGENVNDGDLLDGTYSIADNTLDGAYCKHNYGSDNVLMSEATVVVTNNDDGTTTFDVTYVSDGVKYAFTYTGTYKE